MANRFVNFKMWMRGLLTAHDVTPEDVNLQVNGLLELPVTFVKAADDGAAATATAAQYFFYCEKDVELFDAKYITQATAAALNASNFGTIIVNKHDGAGGAGTVMAQGDTSATSTAAGVGLNLVPSATLANRQAAAGSVLSFQITKTGTGVVLGAGQLSAKLRYI